MTIICISTIGAQNRPQWLKSVPVSSNSTYTFIPITTESGNITIGRNNCLQILATDRGLLNIMTVTQRTEKTDTDNQAYNGRKMQEQFESKTLSVTTFDGKPIKIQAKIVDEFLDRRKGEFSTLYAVALTNSPIFDDIRVTSQYGARGLWRSAIVPGWGQMYKGSYAKGGIIMGGTIALAAGIIVCESFRKDFVTKASQTHSTEAARQYQANVNNAFLARNVCIYGIAALYIYNLVDAIVAPGGRRIIVSPVSYGGNQFGIQGTIDF